MLPFLMSSNTKVIFYGIIAAVISMVVVGQRLKLADARAEIAEHKATIAGCQTAVEVQASAARMDAERLNALASGAANAARGTLARGRQEKRASVAPGAGSEVMNRWLDTTVPQR